MIGTDAFQETPIVEVCRSVTKHHYLVTNVNDIARVMREAFHIATTGRPGPVLVDLPKNVQVAKTVPDYNAPMNLPGYRLSEYRASPAQIAELAAMIHRAKRPVIYAGGGVVASGASAELTALRPQDRHPGDDHRDGPGHLPRRRSALAQLPGHARHRLRQLRRGQLRPAAWPSACGSTTA